MPALRIAHVQTVEDLFDVNKFLASKGLDPVGPNQPDQQILALYTDDRLVGALHAAAPTAVAEALVAAGVGVEDAAEVAGRFQAIEAVAVETGVREREYARALLEAAVEYAAREFDAEVVTAKIAADDSTLVDWYMREDFDVCRPGQTLRVDGAAMPATPEYLDAWKVVAHNPKTKVSVSA